MPDPLVEISHRSKALATPDEPARALFRALAATGLFPISPGDLSIAFVDDRAIARIHDEFMGDPSPTDVITFPGDPEMDFAGEIVVSVDRARARAIELGLPFSRELALYLVHGWLHLAGLRDGTGTERKAMRAAEREVFAVLEPTGVLDGFALRR